MADRELFPVPPGYASPSQWLEVIANNQNLAAGALIDAAEALVAKNFIEVNDSATGRPITILVSDIARIEKNITGKALVITVTDANFTTVETYEQVKALLP